MVDTTAVDITAVESTAVDTTAKDTTAEDTAVEETLAVDTTAEDTTANETTVEDTTAEDTTAVLSKKVGHYGSTYDSYITLDTTAGPATVPNNNHSITLCTVQNLISIILLYNKRR